MFVCVKLYLCMLCDEAVCYIVSSVHKKNDSAFSKPVDVHAETLLLHNKKKVPPLEKEKFLPEQLVPSKDHFFGE